MVMINGESIPGKRLKIFKFNWLDKCEALFFEAYQNRTALNQISLSL